MKNWVVTDRNCNYSAFSGYHRTASDYCALHCLKCGGVWRTKAEYVYRVPDGTHRGIIADSETT